MTREDIWDYPLDAIREAVINTVIHKNYLSVAEVQIKVYDYSIWFWNSRSLLDELNIDALKKRTFLIS